MQIGSSYPGSLLHDAFGQSGPHAAPNRPVTGENTRPGETAAPKTRAAEVTLSSGASATSQQTLLYSQAIRKTPEKSAVGTAYADATGPDTQAAGKAIAALPGSDQESDILSGLPFAKAQDETGLPAQKETGKAEDPAKADTGKTRDAGNAPEPDRAMTAEITGLKQREQEVIAHEAAHRAVGGQYASAASYTYTTGPDSRRYIDGGEVSIRIPQTSDPQEALRLAELLKRAALAPADPSGQDMAVAASATQKAARARVEIARVAHEEAMAKRAGNDKEKTGKAEKEEGGKTGATQKTGAPGMPDRDMTSAQKAAQAYASLSNTGFQADSGSRLRVAG